MAVACTSAVRDYHRNAFMPLSTGCSTSSCSRFLAPPLRSYSRKLLLWGAPAGYTSRKWRNGRLRKVSLELKNSTTSEYGSPNRAGALQSRSTDHLDVETSVVPNYPAEEEELSRSTLIWRAAKPPLYTVALIPCSVSCPLF